MFNRVSYGWAPTVLYTDIDRATFDVMWEMSKPGGEAEGAFLRVPQTDYYLDGRDSHLDWMPDVRNLSSSPHRCLLTSVHP